MKYVEYNSNNSGGRWWLSDEDWKNLEKAGWKVRWVKFDCKYDKNGKLVIGDDGLPVFCKAKGFAKPDKDGRWLGALATYAFKRFDSLKDAVEEWESIVNQSATEVGCPCCGNPHNFSLYDGNNHLEYGPTIEYSCGW